MKRYYVEYWNNFGNTYNLYWAETPEQIEKAEKFCERISRKDAEKLCTADIANFLYMNLRFYDGIDTAYINIDLKLSELQDAAGKRENVIEELENAYVTPANDNIPYLWLV